MRVPFRDAQRARQQLSLIAPDREPATPAGLLIERFRAVLAEQAAQT